MRFNQYKVSACCLLCKTGDEDRVHFIAVCPRRQDIRQGFVRGLVFIFSSKNPVPDVRLLIADPRSLTKIILDFSILSDAGFLVINKDMLGNLRYYPELYVLHFRSVVGSWVLLLGSRFTDGGG